MSLRHVPATLPVVSTHLNGVAAMLVEQTKEATNEKSFVYDHQHDGGDVNCKPGITFYRYLRCSIYYLGSVKDEYNSLIQSFKTAWNSCRSFLGDQGKVVVTLLLDFVE